MAKTRPKLIGGARAVYTPEDARSLQVKSRTDDCPVRTANAHLTGDKGGEAVEHFVKRIPKRLGPSRTNWAGRSGKSS